MRPLDWRLSAGCSRPCQQLHPCDVTHLTGPTTPPRDLSLSRADPSGWTPSARSSLQRPCLTHTLLRGGVAPPSAHRLPLALYCPHSSEHPSSVPDPGHTCGTLRHRLPASSHPVPPLQWAARGYRPLYLGNDKCAAPPVCQRCAAALRTPPYAARSGAPAAFPVRYPAGSAAAQDKQIPGARHWLPAADG